MKNKSFADYPKVGVLTLHYGFNEGAVLQAMATCCLVQSVIPSCKAEIVDHRYPGKVRAYGSADTERKKAILDSVNSWLPLSPRRFWSTDRVPTLNYCSDRYGALVIGSDVVWGLKYVKRLRRIFREGVFPQQIDPFFPAFPNVYWPGRSSKCVKVAFAASCGNLDPCQVSKIDRYRMARALSSFSGISVRDEKTYELVKLCSKDLAEKTVLVPDPTIAFNLFDHYSGRSALEKLLRNGFDCSKKWALLVMKEGPVSSRVFHALKRRGYKIAATGRYNDEVDLNLDSCGLYPIEWGWMPKYFQLNVTERMHSSIFTVLNRVPVVALDMNMQLAKFRTKLEERMAKFGLSRLYMHQERVSQNKIETLIDAAITEKIEWDGVANRIENERQMAFKFLTASFSNHLTPGVMQ